VTVAGLRIGELAARSGFSRDTLRYYERIGLLTRAPRTDGGYRVYSEQMLNRLRVIRNARRFGFSLAEIREFMKVRDSGGAPCGAVRRAAERRMAEVESQLNELKRLRRAMATTLTNWDKKLAVTPSGSRAGLLEDDLDI
jgi:DNA-binding transcriptional MerR regulator